jgi:hypothetical protein
VEKTRHAKSYRFFLLAGTPNAMAGQAAIGDVSVNLPPPAGFCDLLHSNPADARVLSTFEGLFAQAGGKLLGVSADCGQLAGFRMGQGRLLDDYAMYTATLATIDKEAPVTAINENCATLRAEGSKIVSSTAPDVKARVEAALKNVKINQTAFLGVLAEEPRACYAAQIQQARTQAGTGKTILSVYTTTIVKKRLVHVYRYGVYTGPDSVTNALAKLKDNVAAFYAAN